MPGICDVVMKMGKFKNLVAASKTAGLIPVLNTGGPYTLFAPTDDAFDKLPKSTIENLFKNKEKLIEILKYHVVEGVYCLADAFEKKKLKTMQGKELKLDLETCSVNGAKIVEGDITADNGVIHIIDTVLTP
ncbi:MAG: fasciclin domain-containing protein [Candidatus Bathyarchaeota archaeon]|nr:fasciclin domain-containing protein [Candidatus Bathyarchaeota archaeon]MCX8177246.1 fasciclin domain-containing protein [Candidatus Bathyarchaeota archaeon]MDW8193511.1 fasciclin domain-containing protein [Nitrososphaerota archaeon]